VYFGGAVLDYNKQAPELVKQQFINSAKKIHANNQSYALLCLNKN